MNKIKTLCAAGLIGLISVVSACKGPFSQNYAWRGSVPASQGYIADCTLNHANEAKTGSEVKIYEMSERTGIIMATDLDGDFAPEIVSYFSVPKNDPRRNWSNNKITEVIEQAVAEAKSDYQTRKKI